MSKICAESIIGNSIRLLREVLVPIFLLVVNLLHNDWKAMLYVWNVTKKSYHKCNERLKTGVIVVSIAL